MNKEIKLDFLKTPEKKKNKKNEKNIEISGKNNRYLIKKLTTDKVEEEKQIKQNIHDNYFLIENQLGLLNFDNNINNIVENYIKSKRQSYYQQDILKKCYDENKFVSLNDIIEKLIFSECNCFYCRDNLYILYKKKLEKKQWTLDRINNSIGHNKDNVVICCLECNLQRKNKSQDKYLFDVNFKVEKEI